MKLSKRQRLLEVYYQLTCYGKWQLVDGNDRKIKLHKNPMYLFYVDKESYFLSPPTDLTLYSNCTFELSGHFSWYDAEVLESLKFVKK